MKPSIVDLRMRIWDCEAQSAFSVPIPQSEIRNRSASSFILQASSFRHGERGAALWIALMFLVVVMVLTAIGARITVSMLRGEESREKSSEELWAARGVATDLEARLRYDLPAQLLSDVAAAQRMPGGPTSGLGAFDSTLTTTSYPVAVFSNGQLVANPNLASNTPTSLLGPAETWARARAARSVTSSAAGITGTANLAALFELTRNPPYNVFLHYIVDAKAGFNRVRPTGEVQLMTQGQGAPPTLASTDLSISMSAPSSVQVGNNIIWTIPVTNGGPSNSSGSTVTVTLASSQGQWTGQYTLTGAPDQGCFAPPGTAQVQCAVGALANGKGYTLGITQSVQSVGSTNSITATACVVGTQYDPTTPDCANTTTAISPAQPPGTVNCTTLTYQNNCGGAGCKTQTRTVCCPAGQAAGFEYTDYNQCASGNVGQGGQVCPLAPVFTCNDNAGPWNLAQNTTASQSSTLSSFNAGLAVDGNTNGSFGAGTSSATQDGCWTGSAGQWWLDDLGADVPHISYIDIWPRTDCCPEMSSDYYVLVSDNPIDASGGLTGARSQPGVSSWYVGASSGTPPQPVRVIVGHSGRYVMVWLNHCGYLVLAEVQVWAD